MSTPRAATVSRKTSETEVRVSLALDGTGRADVTTGIGFLDHMLAAFARHGLFDLEVACTGDLHVDEHHSVEDVAITLGQAVARAASDKAGLARFGAAWTPMDEALARAVIDLSGRPYLVWKAPVLREQIGGLPVELAEHFFSSFAVHAGATLHVECLYGSNQHHVLEAIWKSVGRALRQAVAVDPRIEGALSTKGTLAG